MDDIPNGTGASSVAENVRETDGAAADAYGLTKASDNVFSRRIMGKSS